MDNGAVITCNLIEQGDQIQIFVSKPRPNGVERRLMVIWRGNHMLWHGPVQQDILDRPDTIVRNIVVRIPVSLIEHFQLEGISYEYLPTSVPEKGN